MINSTPASAKISLLRISEIETEEKLKSRMSYTLSTASSSWPSSLDKLVSNLSLEKLKEAEKVFKDKIELILRKGVYPYNYTSSIEKFNEIGLNC